MLKSSQLCQEGNYLNIQVISHVHTPGKSTSHGGL